MLASIIGGGILFGINFEHEPGERFFSPVIFFIVSLVTFLFLIIFIMMAQGFMISGRQYYPILFCLQLSFFVFSLKLGRIISPSCRSILKKYSPWVIALIVVGNYFIPMWQANLYVDQSGDIDRYSEALDHLRTEYYEKKLDRIPVPVEFVSSFIYPHAGYMFDNIGKRKDYCSGQYFGMPTIEFYIEEIKEGGQ